jgi:hypothetical protein
MFEFYFLLIIMGTLAKHCNIILNTTEIQRIIINYYKQLYIKTLEHIEVKEKFLDTDKLQKLNKEETEILNRET